ncbi:GNAT family N-acetyltransferase [Hoeflea sp. IMCC20628]|uniref:GNAT family N-acetyltransferase n=1 Tax=Hoeflea sp. IMCC20628 TaxID=1620421 RepID=UPI0009E27B03|nr:GNAT family N-acetyltransferase [Hoeflea sp. IMCC20628]
MIPTLETDRLLLRPQTMEDWPAYAGLMMSDHAVFMEGPHTLADAWGMFCHDLAQWYLLGVGALMIEDRKSGQCLGQVGINHGPLFPEHELGWLVYPASQGKGYASEAALALRNWGFNVRGLKTLVSHIDPENHRSRKLAERLGAVLEFDAERPGPEVLVYRHRAP